MQKKPIISSFLRVFLIGSMAFGVMPEDLYADATFMKSQLTPVDRSLSKEKSSKGNKFSDPLEGWNRSMFEFNYGLDRLVFGPAIESYRLLTPPVLQTGLTNVLRNIAAPVTVFNYLFQGESEKAGTALGRFLINTILGLGGLFDVATELDVIVPETDFGETLRSWGGGPGMYVIWPVLGPSIARDSCGMWVDFFLNPLNLWLLLSSRDAWLAIYDGIYFFEQKNQYFDLLETVYDTSLDSYSALRSLYRQKRAPDAEVEDDEDEEEEGDEESDGPRPAS